jgi:hypothetical protein
MKPLIGFAILSNKALVEGEMEEGEEDGEGEREGEGESEVERETEGGGNK